mgnify:FL=1
MTTFNDLDSLYNKKAKLYKNIKIEKKVEICDLTLEADGEEMAGLKFKESERLEIAKILDEVGAHRIAIIGNSPKPTKVDIKSAEKILDLNLNARTNGFVKTEEEILTCQKIGLKEVVILVGINETAFTKNISPKNILEKSERLIEYAKSLGLHVTFMGMDSTRTSPIYLKKIITKLEPLFDEYVIGDSLGRITPYGIEYLVKLIKKWTNKPIHLHPHNTTSLAVANSLSGVLSGLSVVHTTVNGLGEFSGLAATEELSAAIDIHAGISLGLNYSKLQEASSLVSQITGIQTPPFKPITGKSAFAIPETEETQEFMYNLSLENKIFEGMPIPPKLVGKNIIFSIGKKCNEFTVLYNLKECGYEITKKEAKIIAREVRRRLSTRSKYCLITQNELVSIFLDIKDKL